MDSFKPVSKIIKEKNPSGLAPVSPSNTAANGEPKQTVISPEFSEQYLIARNEFNLEKWSSFIFPHARTKGLGEARTVTYEVTNAEGNKEKKSLTVKPLSGDSAYTNRTYTTLLALIIWWHQHPTADGSFKVHLSDLARIKGITTAGKNLHSIYEDLDRLDGTRMDWHGSFIDEYGTPGTFTKIHIITDLSGKDSSIKNKANRFVTGKFGGIFLTNLIAGKTNPKNLTSLMKIRSEIGQIIFRYVDTKIYNKAQYEKLSLPLFEELGLIDSAKKYQFKSKRNALLNRILPEIDKSILPTGNVLRIKLGDSFDGKDIKLICHNIPANYVQSDSGKVKRVHTNKVDIDGLSNILTEAVGITDENFISWTKTLAKYYDKNTIFKVAGDFKDMDRHGDIDMENRGKVFTNYFHKTVHQRGLEWIGKGCDETCVLRPENKQQQELL